jgi:hypothetical protein
VTGSSFHRTGAAADKDKYPWFYEFGIPVDNYATIYGIVRVIKTQLSSTESSEQAPMMDSALLCTVPLGD